MKKFNVCIVGATGLVGSTFLKVLEEYNFPINKLKLLASKRSTGKIINFNNQKYTVEELTETSFDGFDLALFSAGGKISEQYALIAVEKGLTVIDNSSFYRMHKDVPLVVPEINFNDIGEHKLISNPNCSTIQSVLPLKVINDVYKIKRVIYTTFQAVSGSGQKGKDDLISTLAGKTKTFYPYDISKTCIPQIDYFWDNGFTNEEMKMINETRKILHKDDLNITATCVRVPVLNSHAVSIILELENDFNIEKIKDIFSKEKAITIVDDVFNSVYPTSVISNDTDNVYVGRIRKDLYNKNTLLLYTTCDNIRKGAASNAVQIAIKLMEENKL